MWGRSCLMPEICTTPCAPDHLERFPCQNNSISVGRDNLSAGDGSQGAPDHPVDRGLDEPD